MHRKPTSPSAVSAEHVLLGRAVREIRARHGISQEELGHRSGKHRNYIGALERGEVNATFKTLLSVTRGLDVPMSVLMRLYERIRSERSEALS